MLAGLAAVDCVVLFAEDTPLALIQRSSRGAGEGRRLQPRQDRRSRLGRGSRRPGRAGALARRLFDFRPRGASPCPVLTAAATTSFVPSCWNEAPIPTPRAPASFGWAGTLVHCTASVEPGVPGFKKGTGEGWVTAEYAMLPRATVERTSRERNGPGGRTQEIQRLIGRSLRAAMATMAFGEYTIRVDCDVLQADGGTRTAGITGGCVALADACTWLSARTGVPSPFGNLVAAVRSAWWKARSGSISPTSRTATRTWTPTS